MRKFCKESRFVLFKRIINEVKEFKEFLFNHRIYETIPRRKQAKTLAACETRKRAMWKYEKYKEKDYCHKKYLKNSITIRETKMQDEQIYQDAKPE